MAITGFETAEMDLLIGELGKEATLPLAINHSPVAGDGNMPASRCLGISN
ncbi:MAG: hypothetical protein WBX25_36285 [Rhodomicrobium sp.]